MERTYLCIDLKSFYASVECVDRGLDPLSEKLVVADSERGRTTICLAITPAMKALGIPNRCRVFEIPSDVKYIMAKPRMRRYMEVSADIYEIYLRYVSAEDIHVYSIDECFIDATPYLNFYDVTPREFARMLMDAVLKETKVYATAGIGTNLFLAKVALDIAAKHASDRIGFLDEAEFKRTIWHHRPITDIWQVGPGIARRLAKYRVFDLAGVASMDEEVLYREFGVNAEFLIDHAHGVEPCTMKQIKEYVPQTHSVMNGQVLPEDYAEADAFVVMKEMVDAAVLDLVEKGLVAGGVSLSVGYARSGPWRGAHASEGANVSQKLCTKTNSLGELMANFEEMWRKRVDAGKKIRRMSLGFSDVSPEEEATLDLFSNSREKRRERNMQEAVLAVKGKFGKNALVRGMSLLEKATARDRNEQVGGHHA